MCVSKKIKIQLFYLVFKNKVTKIINISLHIVLLWVLTMWQWVTCQALRCTVVYWQPIKDTWPPPTRWRRSNASWDGSLPLLLYGNREIRKHGRDNVRVHMQSGSRTDKHCFMNDTHHCDHSSSRLCSTSLLHNHRLSRAQPETLSTPIQHVSSTAAPNILLLFLLHSC